jgi:DNA-binding NarL/FixJ family response regulator
VVATDALPQPDLNGSGTSRGETVSRASVLLADDNAAVLQHVTKMLEKDYQIVGAVKGGIPVLREWPRLRPDVIVLDISMGEPSGIEVARNLRDSGCDSKIVFLTVHEDPDFVKAAMGAGGSGYVVKSRLSMDLASAIRAVLSGKLFVSASLLYQRTSDGSLG